MHKLDFKSVQSLQSFLEDSQHEPLIGCAERAKIIAKVKASHTGRFLKAVLRRRPMAERVAAE